MTKRMSAKEARENFADVLGLVYYGKEPVIVERKGKPMAVIISPEQYERYERQVMERFGQVLDELQARNASADPDEVQRDIDEAVEETDAGLVIKPQTMETTMTTEHEPFVLTPPTPEQLAQRRAAVADIVAVRAKMPSLAPLTAADLVHMAREEASWYDTTEDA